MDCHACLPISLGQWALLIIEKSLFRKRQCLFELIFYVIEKKDQYCWDVSLVLAS